MTLWNEILAAYALWPAHDLVLATVVHVSGSAYRRPGARMLVCPDGQRVGMISGGCLDKDVARNARAWTTDAARTVTYDTRGTLLAPQGPYGSGCDGVVQILLERLVAGAHDNPLEIVASCRASGRDLAMASCYSGRTGARWVSGAGPHDVAASLEAALDWAVPRSVQIGAERWLVERLRPEPELVVFGAGDDARPLVAAAAALGWTVRVASESATLATQARFPGAVQILAAPAQTWVEATQTGAASYVVVMTHSYKLDLLLVPALLASDAAWIGLMGPRTRTMGLMRQLVAAGATPSAANLARVQTPVGLDLGADAPNEVALSILSGLVAARNGRAGGLLREASGAIHQDHSGVSRQEVEL
jgi:xanthine dehydrogenase accessory factor